VGGGQEEVFDRDVVSFSAAVRLEKASEPPCARAAREKEYRAILASFPSSSISPLDSPALSFPCLVPLPLSSHAKSPRGK
jgi:hypothetical protein